MKFLEPNIHSFKNINLNGNYSFIISNNGFVLLTKENNNLNYQILLCAILSWTKKWIFISHYSK